MISTTASSRTCWCGPSAASPLSELVLTVGAFWSMGRFGVPQGVTRAAVARASHRRAVPADALAWCASPAIDPRSSACPRTTFPPRTRRTTPRRGPTSPPTVTTRPDPPPYTRARRPRKRFPARRPSPPDRRAPRAPDGEHRRRRTGGDGLEPRPQPGQPRGQHGRHLQPLLREDRAPARRAPRGRLRPRARLRGVRRVPAEAAHGDHHGPGRRRHRRRDRRARRGVRAGRHHRRRRQRPVHRHHPPREGGARDGHQLRRRRHLRRRGGRAERPVDHARRLRRVVGHARPDPASRSPRSPRASRA